MGLFRCCRSNGAVEENAHAKPTSQTEQVTRRGENYDEDMQAVRWMRERSLERSFEKELRSSSGDEKRLMTTLSEDKITHRDKAVPEKSIPRSIGMDSVTISLNDSVDILGDLLDESRRSQSEIERLQGTASETLRILSMQEAAAAEQEDRYKRKLDKQHKREAEPSRETDMAKSRKQQATLGSPSKVAPAIQSATKVLMESTNGKGLKRNAKPSGTPALQLDPHHQAKNNVDPSTRDRYMMAVQLLYQRVNQDQDSLSDGEKANLHDLLHLNGDEATIDELIHEIESTVELLNAKQRIGAEPLNIDGRPRNGMPSSSNDDHNSNVYVDILSVNSSASGAAVEATLGNRSIPSSSKRSKVEIPPFTDETPSLINEEEDDKDDLEDSSFPVLGAEIVKPRLLKVRLMEALRGFLPFVISEQNYWLKFSLERDGCSLRTLLDKMRGSQSCLIVIQARGDEHHIFGAFTSTQWGRQDRWFGNGESFLFKLKDTLEVYPYTGADDMVQYCSSQMIAIGGGDWKVSSPFGDGEAKGIGLLLDGDLQGGESYSCATFCNPCLSHKHEFSILNIEVWTLTPCMTEDEAKKLHEYKLLVDANRQ